MTGTEQATQPADGRRPGASLPPGVKRVESHEGHYRGRVVSWVAALGIMAGFAVGGMGLIEDQWWLFWTGLGIAVAGGVFAVAIDMVSDVQLDPIHQQQADPHVSRLHGTLVDEAPEQLSPRILGPDVTREPPERGGTTGSGDAAGSSGSEHSH